MADPNHVTQEIPKGVPKFAHKFIGNGNMFGSLVPHYKSIPALAYANSVYNLAPASKWALSIIPMVGAVTGTTKIEQVQMNTSLSLTITGTIWTVYALMITPQNSGSRALATVNCAMAIVNGTNAYRRYQYDLSLNKSETLISETQ